MDTDVLIQIWMSYSVFQVPHLQMGAEQAFLPLDFYEDELLENMCSAIVLGAIVDGSQIGIPVKQPCNKDLSMDGLLGRYTWGTTTREYCS